MRASLTLWIRAVAIAVVGIPLISLASDLTLPNTFTSGTVIQAGQVNANFTAVQTAVNSKQDALHGNCGPGQSISAVNDGGALVCVASGLAFGASISGDDVGSGVTVVNNGNGAALEGDNDSALASAYGVLGQLTASTASGVSAGVKGECTAGGAPCNGVWGDTPQTGSGVYGTSEGTGAGVTGFSTAGPGVVGTSASPTNAGVSALSGSQTGIALSVGQGLFQVAGAGSETTTTAFTHTATAFGSATYTLIDNAITNNNPNLLLFVTPVLSFVGSTTGHPVGVAYNPTGNGEWAIVNTDGVKMTTGSVFNVLVVSP